MNYHEQTFTNTSTSATKIDLLVLEEMLGPRLPRVEIKVRSRNEAVKLANCMSAERINRAEAHLPALHFTGIPIIIDLACAPGSAQWWENGKCVHVYWLGRYGAIKIKLDDTMPPNAIAFRPPERLFPVECFTA